MVIEKASGSSAFDYAETALFRPLRLFDTKLNVDQKCHAWVYADMQTSPRDMARVGQLMLQYGSWDGKQIISSEYSAMATSPSKVNREMGYLWWILYSGGRRIGYYASGYLNTDIYVLPGKDIVIARTQAPKAGFTWKNESGAYSQEASKIFAKLAGSAK